MAIHAEYGKKTINDIVLLYKNRQINLEPGFQRNSVWTVSDRRRLIESIFAQFPLPNIFLYSRNENGRLVYDVIDGKQRLETILMFMGTGNFRRDTFTTKLELDEDGPWDWDWPMISKLAEEARFRFEIFPLQTVEVSGSLSEIVDLFVRINSTGKRLTSGEKRHARFYESPFLKAADRLLRRYKKYFVGARILSPAEISRMKGAELVSELLMSIGAGGIINKKAALDRAIGNETIHGSTLNKCQREFVATINVLRKAFPELGQTRFRNTAEFYSLFMVVWQLRSEGAVLGDIRRNRLAFDLLKSLSVGVDTLRDRFKKAEKVVPQAPYSDYLVDGTGGHGQRRHETATRKDSARAPWPALRSAGRGKTVFSVEQRRILFNSDAQPKCNDCGANLAWTNFTVDHIKPYTKGGRTALENAQLMCKSCNSKKGGR
jgi:5-methylcytosine-specific restriction endonuclease McrA